MPTSSPSGDRRAPVAAIALAALALTSAAAGASIGARHGADTATPGTVQDEGAGIARVHPLVLLAFDDTRLRFSALGRDWDVALAPRTLLSPAARAGLDDTPLPRFLGGRVVGDERSWVRLARDGDRLSGHLFADGTLYRIEPPSDGDGYRLILVGSDATGARPSGGASTRARDGAPLVSRAMRVGIVVDSRYDERSDGRGLARALGIMNGVDGLYRDQLGLAVVVERVRVHDDPAEDPMRSRGGTVEQVLTAFRDVRLRDPNLPDDLALVHLFSGHEDPDEVIGLGWIDTVCRRDGYDVSMSTPFPYDTLLSAHEIAHNLGALHDEDPRCAAESHGTGTLGLMEERLSGTTPGEFSACSLERLQSTLGASCLVDSLDLALDVRATPGAGPSQRLVAVRVANEDPWRTARAVRTRTRFPAGTALADASAGCTVDGALLICEHGDVAPEATGAVSVLATLATDANGTASDGDADELVATIAPGTFVDSRSGNDRVTLDLRSPDARPGGEAEMAQATSGAQPAVPAGSTSGTGAPPDETAASPAAAPGGSTASLATVGAPADDAPVSGDGAAVFGGGGAGGGTGAAGRALLALLGFAALFRRRPDRSARIRRVPFPHRPSTAAP